VDTVRVPYLSPNFRHIRKAATASAEALEVVDVVARRGLVLSSSTKTFHKYWVGYHPQYHILEGLINAIHLINIGSSEPVCVFSLGPSEPMCCGPKQYMRVLCKLAKCATDLRSRRADVTYVGYFGTV
jgi:hypothetical protein